MNALVKTEIPALQMAESELVSVMQNSVYPGAKLESIKLALGYCKAQNLDPMTKPVHIVPMSVKVKGDNGKDRYVERDVIMPGIGLYRVQAARTGQYVGCSEPEFGPARTMKFKEKRWEDDGQGGRSSRTVDGEVEYPEWCRVTVRRLVNGQIAEFTAVEYWIENYATAGRDSTAPNAMWKKRPRGQLAKCAQAQALRTAVPEIGSDATAEEMEGKSLEEPTTIDGNTGAIVSAQIPGPRPKSAPTALKAEPIEEEAQREPEPSVDAPVETAAQPNVNADKPVIEGQLRILRAKLKNAALTELDLCAKFAVEKPEELKFGQFQAAQDWIAERAAKNG